MEAYIQFIGNRPFLYGYLSGSPDLEKTTVYGFEYFDRLLGAVVVAQDHATRLAIREIGGTALPGTAMEVDAGRVSIAGILKRNSD